MPSELGSFRFWCRPRTNRPLRVIPISTAEGIDIDEIASDPDVRKSIERDEAHGIGDIRDSPSRSRADDREGISVPRGSTASHSVFVDRHLRQVMRGGQRYVLQSLHF